MNLDEVFERVLKTEQTAERRHDQLIQVQKEIKAKQAEIVNVQKATERLQETIRTRDLVALHESKWELELASARLTSLINQHEVVTNRVLDFENQLAEKTLNREEQINGFLKEVQNFAENYDLVDGKAKRKQTLASELEQLKHEEEELSKELQVLDGKESDRRMRYNQVERLKIEVTELQAKIIERSWPDIRS